MRILFTRSDKPASRIIRRVLKEPVSHCALELDGQVIHSNFLGVHPVALAQFTEQCEVWGEIALPDDYRKMFEVMCAGWGKKYDFGAFAYLAARSLCPALPKKNLWQCSGMFLCSEWVDAYLGEPDAMATPYQIYRRLGGERTA